MWPFNKRAKPQPSPEETPAPPAPQEPDSPSLPISQAEPESIPTQEADPVAPQAEPAEPVETLTETEKSLPNLGQPRKHHYVFAHQAMRQIALERPLVFFAKLAAPDSQKSLQELWMMAGNFVKAQGHPTLPADGLSAKPVKLGERLAICVRMPPPVGITEAFFVAIVLAKPGVPPRDGPKPDIRYFVLENGESADLLSHEPKLCEWNSVGAHVNYGPGPAADETEFLQAVMRRLDPAKSTDTPE